MTAGSTFDREIQLRTMAWSALVAWLAAKHFRISQDDLGLLSVIFGAVFGWVYDRVAYYLKPTGAAQIGAGSAPAELPSTVQELRSSEPPPTPPTPGASA